MGIYEKWISKTLTQDDIKAWLKEQSQIKLLLEKQVLDENQLDHVAMCMHHIYLWYTNGLSLGGFLSSVVKNDFVRACGMADGTNRLVLPVYGIFLYNCAPMDYVTKARMH